jgi:hypothetical protein
MKKTKQVKCAGLQRIPNTPSQRHRGESFLHPGQIDEDHYKIQSLKNLKNRKIPLHNIYRC